MLRSREHASFSEAGMLYRKKGLPEVFLGLLFMPFLVGAVEILREEKESHSNASHLFTDVKGWLPDISSRVVVAYDCV